MENALTAPSDEKRELMDKAIRAAERFIERKGIDIIDDAEPNGPIQLVAKEGEDALVFIRVQGKQGDDAFPEEGIDRKAFERFAANWLAHNQDEGVNVAIRFDTVMLLVYGENRAFLRYHRDCLSSGD